MCKLNVYKHKSFANIKLLVSSGKQRQKLDKKVQRVLADNHVSLPFSCLSLPIQRGYKVKKLLFLSYRTAEIISKVFNVHLGHSYVLGAVQYSMI